MNQMAKKILENTGLCTVLALTALMLLSPGLAGAQTIQYLDDGAVPNNYGGWDLPQQGYCWGDGAADPTKPTRPLCIALRLNYASSALCTAGTSPLVRTWSTGVCNDQINTTQATCEAQPDRLWNAATSKCAIIMNDDDRNNVVCALEHGTWVTSGACVGTWIMPPGDLYTPQVLTWNGVAGSAPGPGDQCLRCHNTRTQYNGPRVRDTEDTMFMGHKNMSRRVFAPAGWGGPAFHCIDTTTGIEAPPTAEEACFDLGFNYNWVPQELYPGTDTGQDFHWATGQVDIDTTAGTNLKDLLWIYADWLSAYPRAIYKDDPNTATTPDSPKVSYSCARCHTTGWKSDATINYGVGTSAATSTREPEKSFPGVTWDGVADATYGQVNLKGGITGDSNTMASWDTFGITCNRCHNAAILRTSTATNGFTAPPGMSSHHNGLTAPDTTGTCTKTQWTAEAQCTADGGLWLTACSVNPTPDICTQAQPTAAACVAPGVWVSAPGFCSNAFYSTQSSCVANAFVWQDGWCTRPDKDVVTCTGGSGTNALSWRRNGAQASCQVAGATWSFSKCSIEGVCNNSTNVTTKAACDTAGGQFAYATDVIRCEDIGGHWTGNNTNRGQIITGLCMNCHRQETGGLPYDSTNPATALKVGPYHGTVPFLSHPHANQFLNSPHGKFTGTFAQIPTGKFNYAMTGEYKSFFMTEGEAANTGNGCTGCHDVHTSTVSGEKPFAEECTECHNKDLGNMIHSGGVGTPLEDMATDPMEACVICHMPEGEHLFRINVDETYSTRPLSSMTATANANTAPDGNYPGAVWIDLDGACGKCHGGGVANVETTGSITAGSKLLTVVTGQGANFTAGQRVEVKGAGSPYYDDEGNASLNNDFETYVASVAGDVVTLAGAATKTVTNAEVIQNPIKNNAAYFTKAELAVKAAGIHNDKPFVSFAYNLTPANTLQLNVDASASTCSGSLANCDVFVWTWDDTTTTSSATPTASHTYAAAGTYMVTLTVEEYGVSEGSLSKKIKTFAVDVPPAAGGTACASIINPNTWVGTLVDNSLDPTGVKQVVVSWGDGGANSIATDTTAPYSLVGTVFTRTYLNPGTVTVKQTAYDTIGQANVRTCPPVTLSTFAINGMVYRSNGTTPVASATVVIKKGATVVKTVYTNSLGLYSATGLKPGTYNVTVTKTGYTFAAAPQVPSVVVGPNATATSINSVLP